MPGLFDDVGDWFSGQDMAGKGGIYRPEDYAAARNQLLMQLGAGLQAPPSQRGQIMAGAIPGYREALQGGLKERMLGDRYQAWQGFKDAAARGDFGDLPAGMQEIMKFADPDTGMKLAADYYGRTTDPVNWQSVTTAEGVMAFNPRTRQMEKIGERVPTAGESGGFDDKTKLRTEYLKQSAPFVDTSNAYQRVLAASKDTTGASDIAMVYGFMKMLDPTSAVRETEYATAENAAGIPAQVRTMWNKALDGQRLDPTTRASFLQQASHQYKAQRDTWEQIRGQYSDLAQQFGFDPNEIAIDLTRGVQIPNPNDPDNLL